MMNSICKIITYITISLLLSWIGYKEEGNGFLDQLSIFIIPLLATLLAINITTMALVAGEIRKIIEKFNDSSIFEKTKKEVGKVFTIQLVLFVTLFFILIVREKDFEYIPNYNYFKTIISNAFMIGVFGYYLEVIMDSGKSLLEILNTKI